MSLACPVAPITGWALRRYRVAHRHLFGTPKPRKGRCQRYRGVVRDRSSSVRPWRAQIGYGGTTHNLGRFATAEEAARCYDQAATKFHGPRARLNYPTRKG
jgi:hypothetical protein